MSTMSGSQMDALDSCSSSPHPVRRVYSDEVSTKALKSVLINKADQDEQENRKKKQEVFVEGSFEDILDELDDNQYDLGNQLSVLFKNNDENELVVLDRSNDCQYSVMKDSEPYMKFCPQIFMYH